MEAAYDWTDVLKEISALPYESDFFSGREYDSYCRQIMDSFCDDVLSGFESGVLNSKQSEFVSAAREHSKRMGETVCGEQPLWAGLHAIEDDFEFIYYFKVLYGYMWV